MSEKVTRACAGILARGVYGPKRVPKSTTGGSQGDPEAQEQEPAASQRREVRSQSGPRNPEAQHFGLETPNVPEARWRI